MRKIRPEVGSATAIVIVVALAATIIGMPGCGGEERGPTLSGGREVKSWVSDLRDQNPKIRRQAVLKLGNAADSDPAVADALAGALQDADALVRRDAIRAVAKLKNPGALIEERLEQMSHSDKDFLTRDLAGKALARLGHTD